MAQGRAEEALALAAEALALAHTSYGESSVWDASFATTRAIALEALGRNAEAEEQRALAASITEKLRAAAAGE